MTSHTGWWFSQFWARLRETTTPTAIADTGQVYMKADGYLYYQDNAGAEHQLYPVAAPTQYYGEMYDAVGGAFDMAENNVWCAASFIDSSGKLNDWTFTAGAFRAISAFANAGGGEVTATAAGHSFAAGDVVTIGATANYDGIYVIQSVVAGTSFNFVAGWVATEIGQAHRSGTLTAGASSAGIYSVRSFASWAGAGVEIYEFALLQNATVQTKTLQQMFDAGGSLVIPVGVGGLLDISVGDKIGMVARATIGASLRLTDKGFNYSLTKV